MSAYEPEILGRKDFLTLAGDGWLAYTRVAAGNFVHPYRAQLIPVPGTVEASKFVLVDTNKDALGFRNISGTGTATFTGGVVTPLGTASPRLCCTGGEPAVISTDGNNSTPSTTETYYAELFVPCTMTVTGVALFNGTDVTGNVTAYLTNSAGTNLAHTASTAGSGTDAYQRIPFSAPLTVVGPATYYIATQYNSATARYNTHHVGNFGAGKDTGSTYGTFPAAPTIPTTFTADLGNIASLY